GLPLEKFAEAMKSNGSNSGTLTMKLPKMLEGDFEPHFSVKHMLKDMQIASRLGRSYGLTLGATEVARDALEHDAGQGHGDDDYSSVMRGFFPDGAPGKAGSSGGQEEQATLSGLDERPNAKAPNDLADGVEQRDRANDERAEPVIREEVSGPVARTESNPPPAEIRNEQQNGQAHASTESATPTKVAAVQSDPDTERERRGFFSRILSKAGDY
nr:NAD(P)-dependent oxidoreductase [Burkholderiaceae bacterium]